jgi:predicted nuclease of predicted toxin-antitoxin system
VKILIDMNLSPDWVSTLQAEGFDATHWSSVGDKRAPDSEIMEYARTNGFVVFTHDLDFGTLLAFTHANGPSVIQIRTQDIMPSALAGKLVPILREQQAALESGALVTIDEAKARVRVLPI